MKHVLKTTPAAVVVLLAAGTADAHTGLGHPGGFVAGLVHPLLGLDHLVAMLAAGVYAGWRYGGASWRVLSVAMAAIAGGILLGVAGVPETPVSIIVVGSAVLSGLALMLDVHIAKGWTVAAAVAFGLIHGHSHGAEMALQPGAPAYAGGLLMASASLLVLAAIGGSACRVFPRLGDTGARAFGGVVSVASLFLAAG